MARSKRKVAKALTVKTENKLSSPSDHIDKRKTPELILAFCGPVGSGVSHVADITAKIFEEFKYDVESIKISNFIKKYYPEYNNKKIGEKNYSKRIQILQEGGNCLRDKYDNDILAQLSIQDIAEKRHDVNIIEEKQVVPKERRHITIIDSLKHPDEVRLLKKVYGEMFHLFGVLCPENTRANRLHIHKDISMEDASKIIEKDKSEKDGHGQQLLDTILYADFFIRNTERNNKELDSAIRRYCLQIMEDYTITPTHNEYAMFIAYASSLLSGCLSRQVGAAIVKDGDIIATGRNDVPKFGGGLYVCNDKNDQRCFQRRGEECSSDLYKNKILETIRHELGGLPSDLLENVYEKITDKTGIKSLIEFSRAIHAEMDAITTAARLGKNATQDAELFCTTYPCHHCARHIVAAGIKTVYYIEPYEKSLAFKLHDDSIDSGLDDGANKNDKLKILPFEGVAPRRFVQLFRFKNRKAIKKNQKPLTQRTPLADKIMDRYTDFEIYVLKYLEQTVKQRPESKQLNLPS
ncbi:anti-phage dCTP deaminase [Pseudodesulfovibrio portus]|uniref:Deoxycytidylate deaminase n=1 Tax=Pseudodesulfovibrio portus TaxID=231439 RepID=A0ABM8ASI0_9BACT|nr:anti-phage dCTP deaminase [Pseudodesulfovibrio portus]BDQ34315.1 deoxycytidylate deaminase [Pseudodesulfovibrio portus]